jgi:hypothetical protein
MPVLGEGRMVGDMPVEPKPAKPPIGQIEMDFLTKAPLGTNAKAIAHDQHSNHQFWIYRGPPNGAIEWSQLLPQLSKLHEPVD